MIQHFRCPAEAERVFNTLRKLAGHDLSRWALAGGLAVEIHCLRGGRPPSIRHFNDIDFVAAAFDCIPETLAKDFLFRHVHPFDPPGKTMLQLVDADTSMRIDLFRAYGTIMSRTLSADLPSGPIQLISLEDAVARSARLLLDLDVGLPVPSKHADDYLRLAELVQEPDVETAWRDHRRPAHPLTFRETNTLLKNLIATRRNLLITPEYSKDAAEVCPRCVPHGCFPLANPNVVLSLLGYC
jgi:hypothetical protein